ncbi:Mu transposase C-terminal domain-containing protein [Paracoccus sp. MA]|uniref:Mu transposase C-terminal domain-containing protein n=1 Tax=Paracoccus sp. MA TaxID=2895796 RepID=UPI001E38419B|nr:Mu transposase C-terminal domain-containing protein [Paracoccus sp. MA]UFM64677.1 Mu transposase C-terminal domain-containing protein [Paracoccus sp. MA]
MQMFNLSFDPDRHHYAFGQYDRVTIDGLTYKTVTHGRNEEGWLLELDDGSGRCTSFAHRELSRMGSMGRIRVEHNHYAPETARVRLLGGGMRISELPPAEAARVSRRSAYVEAFRELFQEKLIKITDESIKASRDLLRSRAMDYVGRLIGGRGAAISQDITRTPSARTLRRWLQACRSFGMSGLIDAMNRRGNRSCLMGGGELALLMREVEGYADEKRPTIRTIHVNVCLAFEARNNERRAQGLHPFNIPSYETVRRAIHRLDPYAVTLKREGAEAARKKFMPVGEGLLLSRPLERVEIDENTIDIISLAECAGLMELLTEEERKNLGLDRSKARWFVTVAICATTRCILGMAFSRTAREEASLQVLQMILCDKGKWADATGSLGSWDMHGIPILIVTDNGAAFQSERFRIACADLGITAMRAPAGLPEVRARNERFFLSLNTGLHPRLPGNTFGSIRAKGNADPEARAALTFDDLAFCLVRWIVDIYHNTPHFGLGGETPLHCWRRLTAEWGVQPPPSREDRRVIFGERMPRKLSREGVTVLGMRYHSEALARWMTCKEERNVEVRWHPDDIGQVTVYVQGQRFQVGSVLPGFDGVSAREWLAATRELRAADPARKTYDQQIALQAVAAIRERSTSATTLAGLIAEDWSPARIKYEEDRLFIGFNATVGRKTAPVASDGMGRVIPDEVGGEDRPAFPDTHHSPVSPIAARPALARPEPAHPATLPDMPVGASPSSIWKITE